MTQLKICLRGSYNPVEAKRIIQFLERLGGVNHRSHDGSGVGFYYYIIDGHIERIGANCVPDNYTLTSLQKDCLLPVSWCVPKCESVIKYLFQKFNTAASGNCRFYGEKEGSFRGQTETWGVTLTESQFLALTRKEEREIEGYVCPMDYRAYRAKKGDVFKLHKDGVYKESDYGLHLPAEIVETWEPKYKEEKKPLFIGDDGEPVYPNTTYQIVIPNWTIHECIASDNPNSNDKYKRFSTIEAAENYIVENAPRLNYWEVIRGIDLVVKEQYMEEVKQYFKQLIQSKIKG